ncbi:YesL family protein [Jeotgalibacillus terrae]|uniref:YesL family protein n=1 Tax=Jeotgalibacillus terrae TaxID=587735 RepID=A0ABW5ZJN9_9BACL|nr:DUF624 domain-containing protein [Jeotgalibacillus terrae]MBM7579653.1 putative membrane protein YesL [Jeotgalibacillus terrae]
MEKINHATKWLWNLLILHALWIAFSLRGGILLGVFPSTSAVYAVVRDWQLKGGEVDMFRSFKRSYSSLFKTSNALGWTILVLTFISAINFLYIPIYSSEWLRLTMYAVLFFIMFILIILWMFLFPVLVHYQFTKKIAYSIEVVKTGFLSVWGLILQLLFTGLYLLTVYYLPPLMIVLGIIPLAILQTIVTLNIFRDKGLSM